MTVLKKILAVVFFVVLLAVFASYNPTEEQYVLWAKNKFNIGNKDIENVAKEKFGDTGSLVMSLLPQEIKDKANLLIVENLEVLIKKNTVRENYYLFSIYKTNVNLAGKHFQANVLGVMDNFIVFFMGSE